MEERNSKFMLQLGNLIDITFKRISVFAVLFSFLGGLLWFLAEIFYNRDPVAEFQYSPEIVRVGETLKCINTTSDIDTKSTEGKNWIWYVEGEPQTDTDFSSILIYSPVKTGEITVELKHNDFRGAKQKIKILPRLPVADFNVPSQILANKPIRFKNTSKYADSFQWTFETVDSSWTSTEKDAEYEFQPGKVIIELIAYNEDREGCLPETYTIDVMDINPRIKIKADLKKYLTKLYNILTDNERKSFQNEVYKLTNNDKYILANEKMLEEILSEWTIKSYTRDTKSEIVLLDVKFNQENFILNFTYAVH